MAKEFCAVPLISHPPPPSSLSFEDCQLPNEYISWSGKELSFDSSQHDVHELE